MNAVPLIRAGVPQEFVAFLSEIGAPTQRLLADANLPREHDCDRESLVPLRQAIEFYEHSAHQEGIDNLGLLVGQRIDVDRMGTYGKFIRQSLTLYDALKIAAELISMYNSGDRLWLTEQGDQAWFCRKLRDGIASQWQQGDHCSVMMMINVLREALGPRWRPSEVYLETGWSPMLEQSGPLAEARIVCNYSMTAVVFPRSLLSLPMRQIHDLDIDAIQTLWQASAPAEDFVRSLQQALKPLLTNGYPDVQLAAEIAGMSVRTLQRRLQREGLSYSRLIEQVRFQQAVDYLRDPTIKLSEIAAELGYSDPANFTRAFQRWTGTSPSQFRQLELQGRD